MKCVAQKYEVCRTKINTRMVSIKKVNHYGIQTFQFKIPPCFLCRWKLLKEGWGYNFLLEFFTPTFINK